jgi:hypothetical protein
MKSQKEEEKEINYVLYEMEKYYDNLKKQLSKEIKNNSRTKRQRTSLKKESKEILKEWFKHI